MPEDKIRPGAVEINNVRVHLKPTVSVEVIPVIDHSRVEEIAAALIEEIERALRRRIVGLLSGGLRFEDRGDEVALRAEDAAREFIDAFERHRDGE